MESGSRVIKVRFLSILSVMCIIATAVLCVLYLVTSSNNLIKPELICATLAIILNFVSDYVDFGFDFTFDDDNHYA